MKKVESAFPQEVIKMHRNDKPWTCTELQNLYKEKGSRILEKKRQKS